MLTGKPRYRRPMRHNRYCGYLAQTNRGFLVAFDLHWHVVESRRIDPTMGAAQSLAAFICEYESSGWKAESKAPYGFVFMKREGERILVQATPRDPHDTRQQSFNPHK